MNPRILVVDDSLPMRKILRRSVQMALDSGVEIFDAEHGQAALEVLAKTPVDLVITDVNMPVMGGAELLQRIRENSALAHLPVVVVTSDGSQARQSELEALGVAGYLRKPINPAAIRDVLSAVLEARPKVAAVALPDPEQELRTRVVREVLGQVMESAFVYVEDGVSDGDDDREPAVAASVRFRGARQGELKLWVALDQAREVAQNLIDESDDESTQQVVAELVNVICGRTLGRLYPDEVLAIDPPTTSTAEAAPRSGAVMVHGETGYLAASLKLAS